MQVDSLPAEPPGKPKNTGVGSLSLLQRIFLTQELNQVLLHCRQFLYQLSYQRSTRNYLVSISNIISLLGPCCPLKEGNLATDSPFFAGYFLFPPPSVYRSLPWRRKWQPTPVFSPGKSYGPRSLTGYSPQGRKESDTT